MTPPLWVTRVEWEQAIGYPDPHDWEQRHATFDTADRAKVVLAMMLGVPTHHRNIKAFHARPDWSEVDAGWWGDIEPRPPRLSVVET